MFIHRIKLRNLLSFGPEAQELDLKPLNVLIGPNGAGKSNLVEVIGLLKAVPGKLVETIVEGGGMGEWIWRGQPKPKSAEVGAVLAGPSDHPLRYQLGMAGTDAFRIAEERLEDHVPPNRRVLFQTSDTVSYVGLRKVDYDTQQSVLANIKHPDYPELEYMSNQLPRIALYRDWFFGRNHPVRMPQKPDLPNDFLVEDARNLGLVLNRMIRDSEVRDQIVHGLRSFYEGVDDYHVDIQYGTVQIFVREGKSFIPAARLSDGTLRYLCLLTILCHPNPPPLICLEEPELGLHPDILPDLVGLMRKASERCQLIVTTHSDVIVDALTDTPESVVVCEKHDGSTTMKRLDADKLAHWLKDYRLGELWSSGELGGNRW